MYTLIENVTQTVADFDDIKVALEEKDIEVSEEIPTSEYGDLIRSIPEGVFVKSDVWEEADLPNYLKDAVLYTFASKGTIYIGSNKQGIWKFDIATKIFTQIFAIGSYFQYWFETSKGEIFVSCGSQGYETGIWKLNADRNGFTRIYSLYTSWAYWFESSKGDVIVARASSGNVLRLNDERDAFYTVYTPGSNGMWYYWFESSQGDIFAVAYNAQVAGIYKYGYVEGDVGLTQIYSVGYGWYTMFESSLGEVFFSNSFGYGTLKLNEDRKSFIKIDSNDMFRWIESSKGNIFATGSNGIYKLNATRNGLTQIYSSDQWYLFKTLKGNIFAGSYTAGAGILKLNTDENGFTKVYNSGYRWTLWFEINGNILVSSYEPSITGILKYNGANEFISVSSYGYNFEGQINNHLISNTTDSIGYPILDINSLTNTKFRLNGKTVGNWILNSTQFTKFTGKTPMELFIPSDYKSTLTPVGDSDGNVFVFTDMKLIFNVKPLQ